MSELCGDDPRQRAIAELHELQIIGSLWQFDISATIGVMKDSFLE